MAFAPVRAATVYWDGDGTGTVGGGTGTWNLALARWSATSGGNTYAAWTNGDDAVFQNNNGTVTIGAAVTAKTVTFGSSGYTIGGSSTLTMGAGGAGLINTGTGNATINAPIAGTVGLTKQGSGTLTLNATNTYTGTTTISAGELKINGAHPVGSAITIASSATLSGDFSGGVAITAALDAVINRVGGVLSTMNVTGPFTWNGSAVGAATIKMELDTGGISDRIAISGGDLVKGSGSVFKFDFGGTGAAGTYTLITVSGGTHNFDAPSLSYSNLPSGLSGTFDVSDPNKIQFVVIADSPPSVAISNPSVSGTAAGPVTYTITYTDSNFTSSSLAATDVTLNATGNASGTVAVDASTGAVRTVTISNITGAGTLGISLAAGTAVDASGNTAPAAGPSATFVVDNTVPVITSAGSATGDYLQAFSYTTTASKTVTFNTTALPSGLTLNPTTGVISGTATVAGTFPVTLTATDSANNSATRALTITILKKAVTVSGLTVLNKSYDGTTTATLNTANVVLAGVYGIDVGSVALSTTGAVATFADANVGNGKSVTVTGLTLSGSAAGNYSLTTPTVVGNIIGQPATITLSNLSQVYNGQPRPIGVTTDPTGLTVTVLYNGSATVPIEAGTYAVQVSVSGGSFGGTATGTLVIAAFGQTISFPALSDRLVNDGPVTLNATASSGLPVTYSVTGPVTLSGNVLTNTGAEGTVTVTAMQVGNNNYAAATNVVRTYQVTNRPQPGVFFGTFTGDRADASFGFLLRPDGTGTFAGYLPTLGIALIRNITVDQSGGFSSTFVPLGLGITVILRGRVTGGVITGNLDPFAISFTGTTSGPASTLAEGDVAIAAGAPVSGLYQLSAVGTTGTTTVTVFAGADGRAYVFATDGTRASGAPTTVNNNGALNVTLPDQTRVSLTFLGNGTADGTLTPTSGVATRFSGGAEAVASTQRMINMSARGRTNSAEKTLIAGFVVKGDAAKRLIVRVAGPQLANFNVANVLANPNLTIYNGNNVAIATNDDWGTQSPAADISAQMVAAGAFTFGANSRDAAIVVKLAPGNYTVHAGGGDGVVLTEVYELLEPGEAIAQRKIVNFSVRGQVGVAGEPLTAGFVIGGNVPKRVLVRGVGPTLASTGLPLVANPKVTVYRADGSIVKENDDWFRDPDATAISAASTSVGAFALNATGLDAALIVVLAPGNYTAIVDGVNGSTGIALVEVYELP